MKGRKKNFGRNARARAKRSTGRRILKGIEIAVCLGVIGAFTYKFIEYAEGSTNFQVRRVEIHGLRFLDEHDVLEASSITADGNILFFDSEAVKARVEAMPYVLRCGITRAFPHTVALHIVEREPVATLMIDSSSFAIDRDGVVLRAYAPEEMPIAPFITNVPGIEFVEPGETLHQPAVQSALALISAFSGSLLADDLTLSELAAYHPDDIRMYCDELTFELRWGRSDFARQVRRLEILWNELDGDLVCWEYLDLRFDADLACK